MTEQTTAPEAENKGFLSSIWDNITGTVSSAYGRVTSRVSTAFNENVVEPVKEAFQPMKWLKGICESIFGKETMHGILKTVTGFFQSDDKEAFGSGTFLADLESWEKDLETALKQTPAPAAAPAPAMQPH